MTGVRQMPKLIKNFPTPESLRPEKTTLLRTARKVLEPLRGCSYVLSQHRARQNEAFEGQLNTIGSKAQLQQVKQALLTTELQLSDLRLKFNDIVGLPLKTEIALDPDVPTGPESCERAQCIKLALDSHPEITEARTEVEKASAGVRVAKREHIPDIEAFARYSYQENVPFLTRNFGTFGVHFGYNLFDRGKKRATLRERDSKLAQAKDNLARISDEVEVRVQPPITRWSALSKSSRFPENCLPPARRPGESPHSSYNRALICARKPMPLPHNSWRPRRPCCNLNSNTRKHRTN